MFFACSFLAVSFKLAQVLVLLITAPHWRCGGIQCRPARNQSWI